jgi:hypothetical protein
VIPSVPANDHSCVTGSAEILRWIKAKVTGFAHRSRFCGLFTKPVLGSNCLGRILNEMELVWLRNLIDRFHFAAQTEQMDRDNGADTQTLAI